MAPHEPWHRYPRDLEGAWNAINDLRDRVEALELAATWWRRLLSVAVAGSALIVAAMSVAAFLLELYRR